MHNITKFARVLQNLDAFGEPISFYIKGKTKHTSSFGGFSTLSISIIMIIISINSFINLITRANMSTQQYTAYHMSPPHQTLTRNNFIFSLRIFDDNIKLNNSLFSFSAALVTRGKVKEVFQNLPIDLRPCQTKDFPNMVSSELINIENSLCPANFSYEIYGADGNEMFQQIEIYINRCVNGSNSYITCASQEFIDQYFEEMVTVWIRLNFINRYVDLRNRTNPFQTFIDEQSWSISSFGQLIYYSEIFFRANQLQSYDDILGILSSNIYNFVTFEKERIDHTFVPSTNTTSFALICIRSSNYRNHYSRSYDNLLTVISFIGGVLNALISGFGFIARIVNNYEYKMSMINELYDFDLKENVMNKNQKENANVNEIIDSSKIVKISEFNDNSKIKEKFDRMQNLRRRLIFKISDFAKSLCFCFRSKLSSKRVNLYELAIMHLVQDMDIRDIMKKLQDITKLKNILLYPDKLKLFNFIPPPIISINDGINNLHDITKLIRKNMIKKSRSDQIILFNESDNPFQNLDQYYKNSDIYCMLKKKKDQVSQNVIQSLDPEIADIFDSIEEVKNPSNIDLLFQTGNEINNIEAEGSIILSEKKETKIPQDIYKFNAFKLKDLENKVDQSVSQIKKYPELLLSKVSDISKEKQDI